MLTVFFSAKDRVRAEQLEAQPDQLRPPRGPRQVRDRQEAPGLRRGQKMKSRPI